jgi:membrane peptidoglycan carboxypeptidase
MNNLQLLQQFRNFSQNPSQYVIQQLGIDPKIANDPNAIVQTLMQQGRISQEQYNTARQTANQLSQNSYFSNLFNTQK